MITTTTGDLAQPPLLLPPPPSSFSLPYSPSSEHSCPRMPLDHHPQPIAVLLCPECTLTTTVPSSSRGFCQCIVTTRSPSSSSLATVPLQCPSLWPHLVVVIRSNQPPPLAELLYSLPLSTNPGITLSKAILSQCRRLAPSIGLISFRPSPPH